MTRKEAKEIFLNRGFVNGLFDGDKWRQSIVVISEWLQQESCEDAISRDEVLKQINCWIGSGEYRYTNATDYLTKRVSKIPSIQPKTGHSDHKYNDAYSKGFEAGKKQAFTGYCMQCYDELSPYEQAKLMVEWGADIPDVLDKIRAEINVARFIDKDTKLCKNANASGLEVALDIIDKYKAESEGV